MSMKEKEALIKTEIKYLSDKKPEVEAYILPVCKGVWYIYIDWYEAFELHGTGGSDDSNVIEMYFAHPASKGFDFQVNLHFKEKGYLFGSVYKKSYHGTFYSNNIYEKLIEVK